MLATGSDVTVSDDQFERYRGDEAVNFVRVAGDGERFFAHRFRDGLFRVADPALGRTKHHSANQISLRADEVAAYLARGFLLRMRGERTGQVNLISADEIMCDVVLPSLSR